LGERAAGVGDGDLVRAALEPPTPSASLTPPLRRSCNWDVTTESLKPNNVESCLRASGQTSASGYGDGSMAALDRTSNVDRWSWWTTQRV